METGYQSLDSLLKRDKRNMKVAVLIIVIFAVVSLVCIKVFL